LWSSVPDCTARGEYTNETRTCASCGSAFVFSAGEQRFYFDVRGFLNGPRRCSACRRLHERPTHIRYDERVVVEFCAGKSFSRVPIRRWCQRQIATQDGAPTEGIVRRFASGERLDDLAQSEDPDAIETIRRWCCSVLQQRARA
jgi:hypothetical protein